LIDIDGQYRVKKRIAMVEARPTRARREDKSASG
jgi:hypothetical protein